MKFQLFFSVILATVMVTISLARQTGKFVYEQCDDTNLNFKTQDLISMQDDTRLPKNNNVFHNYIACYFRLLQTGAFSRPWNFEGHEEFLIDFRKSFNKPNVPDAWFRSLSREMIIKCWQDDSLKGETDEESVENMEKCALKEIYKIVRESAELL